MEDKLYSVAKFYQDNLNGRRFLLVAAKKNTVLTLEIFFNENAFKHLTGLHKLEDLGMKTISSEMLFTRVLNKELTYEAIKESVFFNNMEDRIENFQKIGSLLSKPDDLRKSLYGTFGQGSGITADYLLSQKDDDKYIHLFLKEKGDIVLPVTFFSHNSSHYIAGNNTTRWNIVDIEEIKEKDDVKRKASLTELRAKLQLKTGRPFGELKEEVSNFHNSKEVNNNSDDGSERN